MPQIQVTIDGKSYRMACGDGEEAHLAELAAGFGARIGEMRKAFGEIGDMRLHVMAALTLSDELAEARRRMAAAEAEATSLREAAGRAAAARAAEEAGLVQGLLGAAARIDRMASALGSAEPRDA